MGNKVKEIALSRTATYDNEWRPFEKDEAKWTRDSDRPSPLYLLPNALDPHLLLLWLSSDPYENCLAVKENSTVVATGGKVH